MTVLLSVTPLGAAVKMEMIHGRPVVDGVFLNGQGPYRFLLDTGTTLNHLEAKLANSLGLQSTFTTELHSSTGIVPAAGTNDVTVTVGPAAADHQTFLFAGVDVIRRRYPDVQGVLGQEFLSRFDYLLDMKSGRIDFGKREQPAKRTRARFRTVTGRPAVETSLGFLVLDSGANLVTLFNVQSGGDTRDMMTMTGTTKVALVPGRLVIDGRRIWQGDAVAVAHAAEEGATGLLPLSLFHSVYFCNSEGYVVLD